MEAVSRLGAGHLAATMATYGHALRLHQEVLNALNVYPVPDGDTGTNMALTLESVVEELARLKGLEHLVPSQPPEPTSSPATGVSPTMAAVCKAIAHGSLMGARGNSGVILSQLLRGLTGVLAEGTEDADGPDLARGLAAASDAARQAVLRPVEGTILTVARAAAEGAEQCAAGGALLVDVLEASRRAAAEALARTPEQLPVLAQAGVVDAGGSGYVL
ncbi:MAG TPA: DAK2 domain-containing protein, partial [Acidimicrobiales bacterium]|nr:DAK2 domain-containing protein [Acidimicrobiales bacterium]